MRIVKNSIEEIIDITPGKKMEYCGRVCYKSDSNINDKSYIKFIKNIYNSKHLSVLEHERVVFKVEPCFDLNKLINNLKYFKITYDGRYNYVSANIRAWVENINPDSCFYPKLQEIYPFLFEENCLDPVKGIDAVNIQDIPKDLRKYHDSKTFKIICSRACSHQLVRHRVFSFSQESQRYCSYNGEKFGHSVSFIMPIIDDVKKFTVQEKELIEGKYKYILSKIEEEYFQLIELGVRAEDARAVLPNATATTIVMTGTTADWEGFFLLRCDSHAQKEIRDIANLIKEKIKM